MITSLAKMGYPQPPIPFATDNTATNSVINGTEKQKRSRSIDMIFYWVRDIIQQTIPTYSGSRGRKT